MTPAMLAFPFAVALAAAPAPGLAGLWVTADGSAVVRVGRCGAGLCGRIVRVLAAGAPGRDVNNPDSSLRARPLVGVDVLSGFGLDGGGEGRAYDPRSGRTYRARIRLDPRGTLRVTGCVMMICRSQHWSRR